jgi:hypothetical protein
MALTHLTLVTFSLFFNEGDKRWLMGGYIDWDEIRSRINVLKDNLNK